MLKHCFRNQNQSQNQNQETGSEPKPEPKPAETAPEPKPEPNSSGTKTRAKTRTRLETTPPKPAEKKAPPATNPLHERFREIPTGDWNTQKVAITGFTAPGNRYFGSRALAAEVQSYTI